ncbi:hypothetical protein FRC08_004089, partial [Ceratobasidium sp. 394]
MNGEHPKWGPTFGRYLRAAGRRREEALESYLASRETINIAHDGIIPLPLLETMLAVGENMHKIKYQHGGKSLPVLMSTVRQYVELNPHGIFDYYYGYLCLKHIIRTICIAALIECGVLEDFLNGLDPDSTDVLVADLLSDASLGVMKRFSLEKNVSQVPLFLGFVSPGLDAFPCVGGLSFDDVDFLLSTLWNNRHRLITLIESGMVPGFAALLFAICHIMLYSDPPCLTKKRTWTQLHDITVRFYLVGSQWLELHPLILCVYSHVREYGTMVDDSIDQQDANALLHAYVAMFRRTQDQDMGPDAQLELDVSTVLCQYVHTWLTKKLANFLPEVERAGLERLWLELDLERNGFLAGDCSLRAQKFAICVFRSIFTMQLRLEEPANRPALANMHLEVDLPGLAARVMLLALREVTNPDVWGYLLEALDSLSDAIFGPMSTSKSLGEASIVNWIKVNDHLTMRYLGMIPSDASGRYLLEAMKCWQVFGPPPSQYIPSKMCANPRCAIGVMHIRLPDARHTCGICSNAFYCNKRCQK